MPPLGPVFAQTDETSKRSDTATVANAAAPAPITVRRVSPVFSVMKASSSSICRLERARREFRRYGLVSSALAAFHPQRFQALLDGPLGAVECARVVAEVVGEVRSEEERVELERQLRRLDRGIEMPFVDGHADGLLERADPVVHQTADAVAHRAGTSAC